MGLVLRGDNLRVSGPILMFLHLLESGRVVLNEIHSQKSPISPKPKIFQIENLVTQFMGHPVQCTVYRVCQMYL